MNKQQKVTELRSALKELKKRVDRIIVMHDDITVSNKTMHGVEQWIESLPIESLNDSCNFERDNLDKLSMQDFEVKRKLFKEYLAKIEELEIINCKKNEAEIDLILDKVKKIAK